MFLSRIALKADAETSPAFWQEVGTPYGAHQALWRLFRRSPDQRRDFLFRQDPSGVFFALSREAPLPDRDAPWSVEARPFAPKLAAGDRLSFRLRASPTVKVAAEGHAQGGRHDVVMVAKRAARGQGKTLDLQETIQRAGADWLARQSEAGGFLLATTVVSEIADDGLLEERGSPAVRVEGYRQHRLLRRGERPISFSSLDFEGALVVTEPQRFLEKVGAGFGPQKAFGCGLMLLRRG